VAWSTAFVAVSLSLFPYPLRFPPDWRGAFEYLNPLLKRAQAPVLAVTPDFYLLTLQYYASRGLLGTDYPVWGDCRYGAVVVAGGQNQPELKHVVAPPLFVQGTGVVRPSREFWWLMCRVFSEERNVSDVFFLRYGSGNILGGVKEEAGLPMTMLKEFGAVKLYHVPGKSRVWCTLFDSQYYLNELPVLAEVGEPALRHFLLFPNSGAKPHPLFDPAYYVEQNPDVAKAGANPLVHYIEQGAREGRKPHPLFDPRTLLSPGQL